MVTSTLLPVTCWGTLSVSFILGAQILAPDRWAFTSRQSKHPLNDNLHFLAGKLGLLWSRLQERGTKRIGIGKDHGGPGRSPLDSVGTSWHNCNYKQGCWHRGHVTWGAACDHVHKTPGLV